jgi:hypothetical protein
MFSSVPGTHSKAGVLPVCKIEKRTSFVYMIISLVRHDLSFSWNPPLKSAGQLY